jgi:CubicO group peptidase (beta-lactamase class C family)
MIPMNIFHSKRHLSLILGAMTVLLWCLSPATSPAQERSQSSRWHPLDALLSSWIQKGYYPGGAIAVADGRNVLFTKCYGDFTSDTQVYVASAGKWIAAATIAAVVDRTDLGWDDTIDKWTVSPLFTAVI